MGAEREIRKEGEERESERECKGLPPPQMGVVGAVATKNSVVKKNILHR